MAKILILDDDKVLCSMLAEQMERAGHQATKTFNLAEGLTAVHQNSFDIILLDVQLPDGNGIDNIPAFRSAPSAPDVIIITGQGEPDGAEQAILSGAWSYIEKPHVIREIDLHLKRTLEYRKQKNKVTPVPVALKRDQIIGSSKMLSNCLDQLARASSSDVSVLVTGSTGTGKELFAKAIHENSKRADESFVIVDCAALPETLIESTLFGHVRGAFTGADKNQDGLVKHAHKGTLFLDEVGELPLAIQKTFLRLLQEHEYRPVGSSQHLFSDFRLVAATNRDLDQMVKEGTFRADLLFRLKAFSIHLPPLTERSEDIKELVSYFISKICERYGIESKGVGTDFIETLTSYDWPGNIRELYQTIEQVFTAPNIGPTCFSIHLPQKIRIQQLKAGLKENQPIRQTQQVRTQTWKVYKDECEKNYLIQLREASEYKIKTACQISGLSRTRLYQLINKYELPFS